MPKVCTIMFLLFSSALGEEQKWVKRVDALVRSPSRQSESNLASDVSPIQRGSTGKRVRSESDLGKGENGAQSCDKSLTGLGSFAECSVCIYGLLQWVSGTVTIPDRDSNNIESRCRSLSSPVEFELSASAAKREAEDTGPCTSAKRLVLRPCFQIRCGARSNEKRANA